MKFDVAYQIAWHTPDKYLNAIREVMGGIDLDPATDEKAQLRIKATKYYTVETNGLDKPWEGSVMLCPPYQEELLTRFVGKALHEWRLGNPREMIVLIHTMATWERWFQLLLENCSSVCFVGELIQWVAGHDIPKVLQTIVKPEYDVRGSVFFYFGDKTEEFKKVFSQFGGVK